MANQRRPTILQGLVPLILGVVVGTYGVLRVGSRLNSLDAGDLPIGGMVALCAGGVLFAVGFMVTLVVIVRPHFAKRPQDEGT
jgi:hypothetical protein